jgi:hypothetical protein
VSHYQYANPLGSLTDSPNRLKKTQLEPVSSFYPDAQIRKDKEALLCAINVLEMVQARHTTASRIPRLAILKQMQLFVGVCICKHGVHKVVWVLQVPSLVLPAWSPLCANRYPSSKRGGAREGSRRAQYAALGSTRSGWAFCSWRIRHRHWQHFIVIVLAVVAHFLTGWTMIVDNDP